MHMILNRVLILVLLLSVRHLGQDCTGIAVIKTDSPVSVILIDDTLKAENGAETVLPRGEHSLRIVRNPEEWESPVIIDTLRIEKCDSVYYFAYSMRDIRDLRRGILRGDSLTGEEKRDLLLNFSRPKNFTHSAEFKWLLAGVVAFGGAAAYLKIEADKRYDEYQETGEERFLDETRRYDVLSGISFGLLQLNFLYMVLSFLIF